MRLNSHQKVHNSRFGPLAIGPVMGPQGALGEPHPPGSAPEDVSKVSRAAHVVFWESHRRTASTELPRRNFPAASLRRSSPISRRTLVLALQSPLATACDAQSNEPRGRSQKPKGARQQLAASVAGKRATAARVRSARDKHRSAIATPRWSPASAAWRAAICFKKPLRIREGASVAVLSMLWVERVPCAAGARFLASIARSDDETLRR